MIDYTLDTNPILYYLFAEESIVTLVDNLFSQNKKFGISVVTEMELSSYRSLTDEEERRIYQFLIPIYRIPVDSYIAQVAGRLRKLYRTPPVDALIAATAITTNAVLITRNLKDFEGIKELKILPI